MAKAPSKSAAKASPKASTRSPKTKKSSIEMIEQANIEALERLKALGIEQELQNDIEWCLGSYRSDNNPVGLYTMAERALKVFQAEKEKKTKGVTAKMITDLEKALQPK